MKVIFCCNVDLYLNLRKASGQLRPEHPEDIKPRLFTKYFPKYLQKVSLDLRKGPIRSKIKRTKIVQELNYPFTFYHRPDWRILLGNKLKTLKAVNGSSQSEKQFAKKLGLLSGLRSLWIDLPKLATYIFMKNRDSLKVALKKINLLRNLQFLSITNLTKENKALFQKLGQLPRFLNSLETLHIAFNPKGPLDNSELLQTLGSKKNVLNSITSLNLGSLCSPSHFTGFQALADSCPILKHLAFEFSCKSIRYNAFTDKNCFGQDFPVETNYLATLKSFHNLRSLQLGIADTFTCLKDLVLPPFVESLVLNFQECLTKEILLKIDPVLGRFDPRISKIFEESQTLVQFYEKFQGLDHLQTLNVYFSSDSDSKSYEYQSYLLHSFLKRIPTLQNFFSSLSCRYPGLNQPWVSGYQTDSYLPQFFRSCHHLGQTLKNLEIGSKEITYSGFDLSTSRNQFPQLLSVSITGQFESVLPLLEQLVLLGDSISSIKLLISIENTIGALFSLLEQLSKFQMPEKLHHLEIEVIFKEGNYKTLSSSKAELEDAMKKLTEQSSLKAKRTWLKIALSLGSEQVKRFFDLFGERFERFEIIS